MQTIPEELLWPQSSLWGMHDYCLEGAQRAASFNEMIEFGTSRDAIQLKLSTTMRVTEKV